MPVTAAPIVCPCHASPRAAVVGCRCRPEKNVCFAAASASLCLPEALISIMMLCRKAAAWLAVVVRRTAATAVVFVLVAGFHVSPYVNVSLMSLHAPWRSCRRHCCAVGVLIENPSQSPGRARGLPTVHHGRRLKERLSRTGGMGGGRGDVMPWMTATWVCVWVLCRMQSSVDALFRECKARRRGVPTAPGCSQCVTINGVMCNNQWFPGSEDSV